MLANRTRKCVTKSDTPHTNAIVWQYGITGVAGSRPGYLNNPDGLDLVPPHSLLITHRATMGRWPPK